jgi:hypothetical protein
MLTILNDLKTIVDNINLLLINERQNYLIAFEKTKMRYLLNLRKSIFNRITVFVTFYVLRKIDNQYKLLIE